MTLLVRMTADHWTGQEVLPGGELLTLDQKTALAVEKAGHGWILNREAIIEPETEPSMDAGEAENGE